MTGNYYVYIYLDNRKTGNWTYKDLKFNNQPFYVGKGKYRRIQHHLQPKRLSDNSIKSNIINKIIEETGELPIHYKIFENLSFEESNRIETDLIKHFGRRDLNNGILSNMTDGGEGFKNVIFSEDTKKKMSDVAKGTKTYCNNGMSKKVEKYDLNGNLLDKYDSLREAAEKNNGDFKNISSACRGKSKTAYGFIWKYTGKSYQPKIKAEAIDRRKKTYQYTLEGEYIQEFKSQCEAERITKCKHISCVCLGKLNFSGGYQWSYIKYESLPPITFKMTYNFNRYDK